MPHVHTSRVVLSANSAWNLVNFRGGLIRALIDAGYEVVALAPDDADATRLVALGVRHVPITIDAKGRSPVDDLPVFARYLVELRRIRPRAFLGFTVKPNVYGSLAAHGLGIPVVNTVSGLGTAFLRDDWLTRLVKWLYRISLRRSRVVFFQNEDDRALFVANRLVEEGRTALLPGSGVDLVRYVPECQAASGQGAGFCFLLSGRLLWDKGVGEFVEAARIVRQHVPKARFRLIGFLDADNLTAIPAEIVQSWVNEGLVEYLGAVEDVRPALAEADCVVLPSYREGTPRALLEAAAMAKPLIATDVPGCRQVVDHGLNGYLCRPHDAEDLAARMLEMVDLSSKEQRAMGVHSRRKIEEQFDEDIVVARYLDALRKIDSRRTQSRKP